MRNVYDIKYEKELNFVLPLHQKLETNVDCPESSKVLIIIHLHYADTVEDYLEYIDGIPDYIDLIFTASDERVKKVLQKAQVHKKKQYKIIQKNNRGRDISAFLVACRKEILKYDYFCFLHDKKEKNIRLREDIKKWVSGLWDNMIGSDIYINNILNTFYRNSTLGLLVPPFPISDHISYLYEDTWAEDFVIVKDLAERMNLNCDLDNKKTPITLGTVFWAKVSALRKLLEIEWAYEDFDEEPLKDDGTISHAIERILAYVAQDAGFETGWVMTDRYAGKEFEFMQKVFKKAFEKLNKSLDIMNISELDNSEERFERFLPFIYGFERIYIYGAGIRGKRYYNFMKKLQKSPIAFLVSNKTGNPKEINGIPVYDLSEIELDQNCGIIVGVSEKYQEEILSSIKAKDQSFSNIFIT